MVALVTGAAGFIGSTLVDRLLLDGEEVRGIDAFTPYYEPGVKRRNLAAAVCSPSFELVEDDLRSCDLDGLLRDVDVVYHLAGQPGVRLSWADGFNEYVENNIEVTQRLLEAARRRSLRRFVYASSSSVYGDVDVPLTTESHPTRPHSPYGVTKLAAEHLCSAYARNFGVPTTSVRFFTVYGPRQRPDMAFHRMIEAAINGTSFPVYGDGRQIRDFTYVDDIGEILVLAGQTDVEPGTVVNAAGGSAIELLEVARLVEGAAGSTVELDWNAQQAGDVRRTGGAIELAGLLLQWKPRWSISEGIAEQVRWHQVLRLGEGS